MLRVGLTGELGSGKSTVARLLAARGAVVFSSDEMARAMMQPGHTVYAQIVAAFGPAILQPDATIDRRALARLAFDATHPRIDELNRIVHPAVIAEQARLISEFACTQPNAIVIVESALLLTTKHVQGWRDRFDVIVLVTAPEPLRVQRFVHRTARTSPGETLTTEQRAALEADARARLRHQHLPAEEAKTALLVENSGDLAALEHRVDALWHQLTQLHEKARA